MISGSGSVFGVCVVLQTHQFATRWRAADTLWGSPCTWTAVTSASCPAGCRMEAASSSRLSSSPGVRLATLGTLGRRMVDRMGLDVECCYLSKMPPFQQFFFSSCEISPPSQMHPRNTIPHMHYRQTWITHISCALSASHTCAFADRFMWFY